MSSQQYKKGDAVLINFGHKTGQGFVTKDQEGKYVCVKHDNFACEVFGENQLTPIENA